MGESPESVGTLPNRQAWYLVFALTVCNVIATVDRMAMTVLVTPMQQSLGLSDTDTGLIGGLVLGLFYALAGLPIAHYADRLNRRNLICIALVLWSFMTALCGLAVGFWSLFLARVAVAVFPWLAAVFFFRDISKATRAVDAKFPLRFRGAPCSGERWLQRVENIMIISPLIALLVLLVPASAPSARAAAT